MKTNWFKALVSCALVALAANAWGFAKTMYPYDLPKGKQGAGMGCTYAQEGMELELGKWYTNWKVCKNYCDKNGIPLVMVWSNATCIHCWYCDVCFTTDRFKQWASENDAGKVIYCFMAGNHSGAPDQAGSEAYNWMWYGGGNRLTAYPFTVLWWKEKGINIRQTGDQICNSKAFTDASIPARTENVIAAMTAAFKDWHPVVAPPAGTFACEESESNRLEVEATTTSIQVDFVRDAAVASLATNATLRVLAPNASTVLSKTTVKWSAGATNQSVEVAIPAGALTAANQQLTLELVYADGTVGGTNHVTLVDSKVSAGNPLWLTERTAPSAGGATLQGASVSEVPALDFGEWTMDIDGAKALAKNATGAAYTLVSVQGSLWCPDCAKTEKNFLGVEDQDGNNKFEAWAKSKQIALAVVDIPNYTNSVLYKGSCLLLRTAGASGVAASGVASGLGYLTRKGISEADAAQQLAKFHTLASTNTDQGGLHRPEDGNKFRTGVPIFVLLNKEGEVVARLTRLASVSPTDSTNFDNYMKRFEEMLKIADAEGAEIENNYPGPKAISFKANGGSADGEISHTDFQDTFKLDGVGGNARQLVTVKGATDAEVGVTLMQLVGGEAKTIGKTIYGKLSAGVSVENEFTEAGDFYVEVKGKDIEAAAFKAESTKDYNFHPFTVTGRVVFVPGEEKATGAAAEGATTVTVLLEKDQVYRLEGLDVAANAAVFKPVQETEGNKFFTALKAGNQEIALTAAGGSLTYQKWVPSTFAFTATEKTTSEANAETISLDVVRQGGKSGTVKVRVALDEEATDLYDFNGEPRFTFTNQEFTWADGETATQKVEIVVLNNSDYDGNGKVTLKLEVLEDENNDTALENAVYTLNVVEDEKQNPGRGAIVAADPDFAAKTKVFAKEDEGVTLTLARLDARDGDVEAQLKSSLSTAKLVFDGTEGQTVRVKWANRDSETKAVQVKGFPAGKTTTITLSKVGTFNILSSSNAVTVVSVAADAPEFQAASEALELYRYVAVSNTFGVASTQGGTVTFKKLEGTLPTGLKVTTDAATGALVLSGVPTAKAGVYTSTFQVSEKRGTKVVQGLVKKFVITIVDPTDVKKQPETANPALAKSRTFKDLPVIDRDGQCLAGYLQVTVPATGKASAKLVCSAGSVSFSAKSWTSFDPETLTVETRLTTKKGMTMDLAVYANGALEAVLTDSENGREWLVETDGTQWSKTNSAETWKGYYTVALPVRTDSIVEETEGLAPRGAGYLTLKMDTSSACNSGTMTWAGMLPNGTKISGKTLLTRGESEKALLPIFTKSTKDEFSALAEIKPNAQNKTERRSVLAPVDVTPYWIHTEKTAEAKASYSVELDVFGGIYDKTEDLVVCCTDDYSKTDFSLKFDTAALIGTFGGVPGDAGVGALTVDESTIKLVEKPMGLSLSFTRSTGVVTGSVRIPVGTEGKYVTAKYAGVVLTGWGDGCGCGPGDAPVRPLLNGLYYFSDKVSYEVEQRGKIVTKTLGVTRAGEMKAE